MKLRDLVTAKEEPGRYSLPKVWANIAYVAATYKFVVMANPPAEIWLYYMIVVGSHTMASKLLDLKYGVKSEDAK